MLHSTHHTLHTAHDTLYAQDVMSVHLGLHLLCTILHSVFCFLYSCSCAVLITSVQKLWVYAYFLRLAPDPVEETAVTVPFSEVYDGPLRRRTRESFMFFRQYFDTVAAREVSL